jgi:hypothetical protein
MLWLNVFFLLAAVIEEEEGSPVLLKDEAADE